MMSEIKSLSKTHQQRWDFAQFLIKKLKNKISEESCVLWFDDCIITPDQIIINNNSIFVKIGNCTYSLFDCDPDWDDGIHDNMKVTEARFRKTLKLFKEVLY